MFMYLSDLFFERAGEIVSTKSLKPTTLTAVPVLGILSLALWLASKSKRENYFKYTVAYREKDVNKIPSVLMDK